MKHLPPAAILGPLEITVLKALAAGKPGRVPSHQRLRLEMLGLACDGPGGLELTAAGRKMLRRLPAQRSRPEREITADHADTRRDKLGRRRGNERSILD
jgi:hypothetical protein